MKSLKNKKIQKVMMVLATIAALGLSACTGGPADNQSVTEEANDTQSTNNKETTSENEEFKPTTQELFLGITKEQKDRFIEKYGSDAYQDAVLWTSQFLKVSDNSTVSDSALDPIKEKYSVEVLQIPSSKDDHVIPADYVTVDGNKDRDTVIFVHGAGCNRRTNIGHEEMLLDMGYNVLTFDLPSSGENKAPFTTYGALEQYDVLDCIKTVKAEISEDKRIFLFGGSYGGCVTAVCLGNKEINDSVSGVILDCPVASFAEFMKCNTLGILDDAKLKSVEEACSNLTEELYGFSFDDVDGTTAIAKTTVPVLIFTSKTDNVVPMEQPQALYDAVPHDNKKIVVFENSAHTSGIQTDYDEFSTNIKEFLEK